MTMNHGYEWATIDESTAPGQPWKGKIFRATSEAEAREKAHAFGYTVLTRLVGSGEWRKA